jgi:hypothetical protein
MGEEMSPAIIAAVEAPDGNDIVKRRAAGIAAALRRRAAGPVY